METYLELAMRHRDKPSQHYGPMCRCGSRNTRRIGDSALIRQCQACGQTYKYMLHHGLMVPFALETAAAMEEAK